MDKENQEALHQMGKGFTHPDLEEKEEEIKSFTNQEIYDFMESTVNAMVKIKEFLREIKRDHYDDQGTKDTLDETLDEIETDIDWMITAYEGEEE